MIRDLILDLRNPDARKKSIVKARNTLRDAFSKDKRFQEIYQSIYKPYKRIKGYPSFVDVAIELAMMLRAAEDLGLNRFDLVQKEIIFSAKYISTYGSPVYWLDKKLAESFLLTDTPSDLQGIIDVIPHMILMLPPILQNPDGDNLEFLFVHCIKKEHFIESFDMGKEMLHHINQDSDRIRWITSLRSASGYSMTIEIPDDGQGFYSGDFSISNRLGLFSANTDIKTEEEFTGAVRRLVVNSLLYMKAYKDTAFTEENVIEEISSGSGFSKSKKEEEYKLNPVWIGKDYKPKHRQADKSDEESARKYDIHTKSFWRRGHYRQVHYGKKEDSQRRLVWIEPVLITR